MPGRSRHRRESPELDERYAPLAKTLERLIPCPTTARGAATIAPLGRGLSPEALAELRALMGGR
jgi:hypothetical protein